jgi:PAS domain S-box-containing protein
MASRFDTIAVHPVAFFNFVAVVLQKCITGHEPRETLNVSERSSIAAENSLRGETKRYGLAILAAVAALLLRSLLAPIVGNQLVYMILWPAVVFSSWYCGVGPAIVTVIVGVVGVWFWFLPHLYPISFQYTTNDITNLTGFLIVSALIIVMGDANRRGRERERRSTEETSDATAKYQALFQQTTVFAAVMTADGTIIEANRLCLDVCGYREDEVIGKLFWDCGWWRGHPDAQAKIRAATPLAARGTVYREVLPYLWADGSEHVVDFSLHPIRDGHGKILFLNPTGVDITELKAAEESNRKLAEALEHEVRLRTAEVEQRTRQLRDLSRRLLQAQDDERRKIARELHDSAGQDLAAIRMNLDALLRESTALPPSQRERLSDSIAVLEHCNVEIRTMSYLLHPPLLDELGLRSALAWYLEGFSERSGIKVDLQIPDDLPRMTEGTETALFRVVQQSLVNIHRHSGSHIARISIDYDAEQVILRVTDEGKGITPEILAGINTGIGLLGVGMAGMRERVRGLEGEFEVSSDENGTTLQVILPVTRIADAAAS